METMADRAVPEPRRFVCTPRGEATDRRAKRRLFLTGLVLLMLAVAGLTWWQGRGGPALIALGAAFFAGLARALSSDLDVLALEVDATSLVVEMRRRRERIPLAGSQARFLTAHETGHLRELTSYGGTFLGSASYDSHLLGEFDLYATHLDQPVLVVAGERQIIVAPDDADGLVQALDGASSTPPSPSENVVESFTS